MSIKSSMSFRDIKMRFRDRWRAKCVLSSYPMQAAGFTLIELSIVLVIMGLIVGGVLVGQDLIKAAQLRAVVSEYQEFQTAANTFRIKYNAYPMAIKNASTFWTNCIVDPNASVNTCDGDGNISDDDEIRGFRLWQHLSLAELIDGNYNGFFGTGGEWLQPEINIPTAPLSGSLWSFAKNHMDNVYNGHFILVLGKMDTDERTDLSPSNSLMPPIDASSIDTKIDDASPVSGSVYAMDGVEGSTCRTGNHYALTETEPGCVLGFTKLLP